MGRSLHRRSLALLLLAGLATPGLAQMSFPTSPTQFLVCNQGDGRFHGSLPDHLVPSAVTVDVEASRHVGFASHSCEITLSWQGSSMLVGDDLDQADIDVMGADLGLGEPVVAFQVKPKSTDPTIRYEIYSLAAPPRLLRTIVGEAHFSAADTGLDGTVEIWTTDMAAIRGFDDLPRSAFNEPPATILRFEAGRLIDVSSEYRPYFDRQIQQLRAAITPADLQAFLATDGRLAASPPDPALLATKVRVLEMAWAYLNSGRPQQAWTTLSQMWPSADAGRVRAAMLAARKHGLESQVDGVSDRAEPPDKGGSTYIFSGTNSPGLNRPDWQRKRLTDTAPEQILLRLPSPKDRAHWNDQHTVEVLVDEAGKVRTARMIDGKMHSVFAGSSSTQADADREWLQVAGGWKYIPAFKDGKPRAYRDRLRVSRDR